MVGTKDFESGEFVVEYLGDLISMAEAKKRESIYTHDENVGCYMYYFVSQNTTWW